MNSQQSLLHRILSQFFNWQGITGIICHVRGLLRSYIWQYKVVVIVGASVPG